MRTAACRAPGARARRARARGRRRGDRAPPAPPGRRRRARRRALRRQLRELPRPERRGRRAAARRRGGDGLGPPLRDAGALAADFYLRTGYMPLGDAGRRSRGAAACFHASRELRALVAYVASLGTGPPVPQPHPERGNVADGPALFTEHCAGCHQIVAEGGYVTGARVPPLDEATAASDRRGGADRAVPDAALLRAASPTASSTRSSATSSYAKHPDDRGGWAIGHLGPVPEGLVTWLIAARRARRRLPADRRSGAREALGLARRGDRCCSVGAAPARRRPRARADRPGRPPDRGAERRRRAARCRRAARSASSSSTPLDRSAPDPVPRPRARARLRAARRRLHRGRRAPRRHRGARGRLPAAEHPPEQEAIEQIVERERRPVHAQAAGRAGGGRRGRARRRADHAGASRSARCSTSIRSFARRGVAAAASSTRTAGRSAPTPRGGPSTPRSREGADRDSSAPRSSSSGSPRRAPPAAGRRGWAPRRDRRLLEDLHARGLRDRALPQADFAPTEPRPALVCPCHYSTFDPAPAGRCSSGPPVARCRSCRSPSTRPATCAPPAPSPARSARRGGGSATGRRRVIRGDRPLPRPACGAAPSLRSRCATCSPTTGRSCWARSRSTRSSSSSSTSETRCGAR